jgi:phage-Barnase-EndoU-ColicinE5/D-RelE like nuclease4
MLDIHTFAQLNRNPSITDISLKMLQDYYDHYLLNNTYEYHLQDGQVISVPFLEKDMCHLLGIKKLIDGKGGIHPSKYGNYLGVNGYKNIKNGTIDFKHLKKIGGKRFNFSKDKMVFFFLVHRMAEAPHDKIFVEYEPKEGSRVSVRFLVYDICETGVGHLGINFDDDKQIWFPQSYMTERINSSNDGMSLITGKGTIGVEKVIKR